MNKKKMATVLGSVTLIGAIGIGGTLAYLSQETKEVSNTFTLGKEINIALKESSVGTEVDAEGKAGAYKALVNEVYGYDLDGENSWTVDKNKYEGVVLGETVYKDPTVLVDENSSDAYIYVAVKNASPSEENDGTQFQVNIDSSKWKLVGKSGNDTFIYAYKEVAKANDNLTVFTNAKVRKSDAENLSFNNLDVKAYAIQARGIKQDTATVEALKMANGTAVTPENTENSETPANTETPEVPVN